MKKSIKEIKKYLDEGQIMRNELNVKLTEEFAKRFNFNQKEHANINLRTENFEIYWYDFYFYIDDSRASFSIAPNYYTNKLEIIYEKNFVGEKLMLKFIKENLEDLLDFLDIDKTKEITYKPF